MLVRERVQALEKRVKATFRDEILIRPPCEAASVLIGVTEGCSWGRCKFCGVYEGKVMVQEHRVRPWESIARDIDAARLAWGPGATRAFLAGGNALSAPAGLLLQVLERLHERFPRLEHVSAYAKNHDALGKTSAELASLHRAGLATVYMGLESGSDAVLKYMTKGTTARGMVRAARAIKAAGITLSVYVILGLGGTMFPDHARETARVLNVMQPDIIRFRSLNFIPNAALHDEWRAGRFQPLRPVELVEEERAIIEGLDGFEALVLNDHVSNLVDAGGRLPGDKARLLRMLDDVASDPRVRRLDHANRTSM